MDSSTSTRTSRDQTKRVSPAREDTKSKKKRIIQPTTLIVEVEEPQPEIVEPRPRSVTPVIETVIEEEKETKEEIIGTVDDPELANMNLAVILASSTSTELVPVNNEEKQLVVPPVYKTFLNLDYKNDISHELAHMLGCVNVYFKDIKLDGKTWATPRSYEAYGTQFYHINTKPFAPQRFFGNKLRFGCYVLMPIATLGRSWLPPYGTLDKIKNPAKPKEIIPDANKNPETANIDLTIRPVAWNRFNQTENGADDQVTLDAAQFINDQVEANVHASLQSDPRANGKEWLPATYSPNDVNSKMLYCSRSLTREIHDKDSVVFDKIVAKTYKAPTEFLTKMCLKKAIMMNEFPVYRLTTAQERSNGEQSLTKPMTDLEKTAMQEGDLHSQLLNLSCFTKESHNKLKTEIEAVIWYGSPSHYIGMMYPNAEEFLKCVPDPPVTPTEEELYKRKIARLEKEEFERKKQALKDALSQEM